MKLLNHPFGLMLFICLGFQSTVFSQGLVSIEVKMDEAPLPISPFIYGKNNCLSDNPAKPLEEADWQRLRDLGIKMFRESGGNNSTKYNWRRKLTSHPDWYNNVFSHDWDYAAGSLLEQLPESQGMWSFQLAGKAARSGSFNFSSWAYNQSQGWSGVSQNLAGGGQVNPNGGSLALVEGDTALYLEHWNADSTAGILDHWFNAGGLGLDSTKIRYWNMDNEPEIWAGTHDDVWPEQPDAEEFIQRYVAVAKKVRAKFPGIKLAGPVPANEWQWYNWNGAKISYEGNSYVWLEYFIKRIAEEEALSSTRLLDVLDIHFYPSETNPEDIVQLHRVYFDREFDYPGANGVKRSGPGGWDDNITREYIFGRCNDWLEHYMGPDHGITFSVTETGINGDDPNVTASWYASTLGEFAKEGVEIFTPWTWKTGMDEVIHLFSQFGHDYFLPANSSKEQFVSAYSMVDEAKDSLTIFLVNRHLDQAHSTSINIPGFPIRDGSYSLYQLSNLPQNETFVSGSTNALQELSVESIANRITLHLPPLSVSALVIASDPPDSEFGYLAAEAEAEAGVLTGVSISSAASGYSGSGYVTGFDNDNDQVEVTISLPDPGLYKLVIRYRNSSGDKIQNVIINEGFSFPVSFPYGPSFAGVDAGSHFFHQGNNTVTIQKSWGWTDIDQVQLYHPSVQEFQVAPELVDPGASSETRELYGMLKQQYRHRIISGQTHSYYEELKTLSGKSPLLRAGDLSSYTEGYPYLWSGGGHTLGKDPDGSVEQLIDWHTSTGGKGIVSFQWHWHSPTGGIAGQNNFYTENTTFDITKAVTPGTGEFSDILRDIDDIAAELSKFQEAGIPVLWRPLHEAGGGWFWWGAMGAEPCKALYNILFDRLTNHHGLHNLIWVWSTPEEAWYPGKDRVDIIGHDSYPGHFNYGNQKYAFDRLFDLTGGEKLIAMTENGPIPDPDACLDQGAPWLYFMSWSDLVTEQNATGHIQGVFNHPDVLSVESQNFITDNSWRSSLYPEDWKPGFRDSRGRFLHDFSYAGYRGGSIPVPSITENIVDVSAPPYSADNSGTEDVTSILQEALNDVGNAGGGVVFLPAGTYRIKIPAGNDHGLEISHDNVVLRGAGPESTFLFHDETYMRQKEIIYVAPAYASWFSVGANSTGIRFDLNMPTRVIPVESVAGYQVGDQVIVRNYPTEAFIAEHGMTGLWTSTGIKGVAFKRRIDSIDVVRQLLILDTPTRYPLKTRDQARVYKAGTHLQECGIESLSIGNRENPKPGWTEEDFNNSGTGAYDAHFSIAIMFENSENCWVKNVNTYKPAVNSQDVHLLSNCLLLNMCRHITVESCDFQKPQYEGGGGNGYMYTLQSNDCLITNSRANHSRHNYDFKYPYSNGNVIHSCRGENSKYASDFHMYLSMSNLFDRCTVNGDFLESTFRPYGSPIHGHASTQSVFYNTVGEAYHPDRDFIIDSRQYIWGYVIGTSGPANSIRTDPVSGSLNGYPYDTAPRDFVEGVGEGATLTPPSLYLDQLNRRANDSVRMHTYNAEIVVRNAQTGEVITGCNVTIYDEARLTDGAGSVLFQEVPEMFLLEVEHEHYVAAEKRQMVIYSDTLLNIQLEESNFQISFLLLDAATMAPLWGVNLTLNEITLLTDNQGEAGFTGFAGSNAYSTQKPSYAPDSGILDITSDTVIQILLQRTHANLKIWLKDGTTPVNNATVSIGNDSLISTSLGLATFKQLPVLEEYHYAVYKEGYELEEGILLLQTDTSILVAMKKSVQVTAPSRAGEGIRIWPNPVSEVLFIQIPPLMRVPALRITDLSGRVLQILQVDGELLQFNVAHYPPGTYIVMPVGTPLRERVTFNKHYSSK